MIGTHIGSYEIIEAIGQGGMATVYRAYQAKVDRYVAMKVIRQNIPHDEKTIQRFQREARLVARLEHPHILPVYDFDGAHEPPYIVMRLMDSGTLRDVLDHGFLPAEEIIQVLGQLATALDYAHQQGVVHRDVKPSNIMLDREGNAFLTDLGIARISKGEGFADSQVTESGSIVGTPDYMAPEQIMDSDLADPRSDVYALGVVAFQMMTGELPFDGSSPMMIMLGHLKEAIPQVSVLNSRLPARMDAIIYKALAKDADERYQTPGDLVAAIAAVLGNIKTASSTSLRAVIAEARDESLPVETRTITEITLEQQRTVTAVYVDMMDVAEGLRGQASTILENLLTKLASIVYAGGGEVMTQPGHALIGLWGAATVHEDDAERAVRAALDMQAATATIMQPLMDENDVLPLLNIGVNTGTIMLMMGSGGTREISIDGDALSLARRISGQAFGTVLVSQDTYRQIRGVFDIESETTIRVRRPGANKRNDRLALYVVTAVKDRPFSMRVRGVEGVETALVGRRGEMEALQKAFYDAIEDHETRAVTLIGAAGLGKTRVLRGFLDWVELRPETVRLFRGRATLAMTTRPYGLLRDIFSFRFEILDSDEPDTVRTKLEDGVHELTGLSNPETAHLIGYLCGFDLPASPHIPVSNADGETLAVTEKAVRAVQRFIALACRDTPLYIELDDIHYADDATLDILADLLGQRQDLPLLIAIGARPELWQRRPNWGSGLEFHTLVQMRPLDRRDSRDLAAEILQKVPNLPRALRDLLVQRAEGNPYYMEELVKMLIEDRVVIKDDDEWTVEESRIPHLAVPPTLIGLLQARIDTLLYPERVVLQRASVLGRVFHAQAVKALADADGIALPSIQVTLDTLVERGFIYRRERSAFAGTQEYVFAQAMIRDRIYDSLPDEQRRQYSLRAAEWLINRADDRADEYIGLIADLYDRAGEAEKAFNALRDAAQQAESRGAYRHALGLHRRALALLPEHDERRGALLVDLADAERHLGELDAADATVQAALEAGQRAEELTVIADAQRRIGLLAQDRGELDKSRFALVHALELARELGDSERIIWTLNGLGITLWQRGELDAAIDHITEMEAQAVTINAVRHQASAANILGIIRLTQERYDEAQTHFETMLRIGQQMGNVKHQVIATVNLGEIERLQGRYEAARDYFYEGLVISEEQEFTQQILVCEMNLGDVSVWLGDFDAAHEYLRRALTSTQHMGAVGLTLYTLALVARLYARTDQPNAALDLLGVVMGHPAADEETRGEAERVRDELAAVGISDRAIETGLARGAALDLDALVTDWLREA